LDFENAKTFSAFKKQVPNHIAKLEPFYEDSSDWRAILLITRMELIIGGKEADYWRFETPPKKPEPGKRNDLIKIRDLVKEGANMR
jgi:hypothetical protein